MYQSCRRYHYGNLSSGPGFIVPAAVGGGGGPITLVNTARGETASSVASLDSTSFNAAAGNLIVVVVRAGIGSPSITVTDTAGNTYTSIDTATGNAGKVQTFYAKNITGNAGNVITANFSPNGQFCAIAAAQYSGLDPSSPLDAHRIDVFDTNTTNPVTGTFSTAQADEVLVVLSTQASDITVTAGTGYTIEVQSDGTATGMCALEDKIVSATQSGVTADINGSSSIQWILAVATFKKAA